VPSSAPVSAEAQVAAEATGLSSTSPAAAPGPAAASPSGGGGGGGGGSTVVNVQRIGENGLPEGPYTDLNQKSQGVDTNRTDPITPETGSKQTTTTANSVAGPEILRSMTEKKVASEGPEAVFGNARERANMGKGGFSGHSFSGPYDYPIYPGGRPDESLTGMGAWRTKNGNHSSLWSSNMTAKGAPAKRNKYFKWSTKGGGNWRKLNKEEMMNVFQKQTRQEGGNFYGVVSGMKFRDMIHHQLAEKQKDIALGKIGAAKSEAAKMGWVDGQSGSARKKRRMGFKGGESHQ
jgi:hypothetical protein